MRGRQQCGEELVTIAEIPGHTDIRITKRYSHAMHERKRQALEKLAATPNLRQMQNGSDLIPCRKRLILPWPTRSNREFRTCQKLEAVFCPE
jgi:hypothetical protein